MDIKKQSRFWDGVMTSPYRMLQTSSSATHLCHIFIEGNNFKLTNSREIS